MRMLSRSILYLASALALAFSGLSYAYDLPRPEVVAYLTADCGKFGVATTKYEASQAHMYALNRERTPSLSGGLVTDSHGYLQVSADEVAKGTTGSTVSLTANA